MTIENQSPGPDQQPRANGQRPPKPEIFNGDLTNLPAALEPLKRLPQWVGWKLEWSERMGSGPSRLCRSTAGTPRRISRRPGLPTRR